MTAKALLVGAPRSGAGKTTLTVGLIAALKRRGRRVRALKCGPDYIDAAFHSAASGAECANIDSWAMSPGHMAAILKSAAEPDGMVIVESAMGLFDGVVGQAERSGAAADIAIRFGIPVILVIDIAGQAQSAGAVAKGFSTYDPNLTSGGVILNGVASERHLRTATEGLAAAGISLLGWVPRRADFAFQDRHLGLVQARERRNLAKEIAALADQVERTVDLDRIEALARPPLDKGNAAQEADVAATRSLDPPGQRIALADDDAFSFIYPHMTAHWRRQGAEIVRFSPLNDEPPRPIATAAGCPAAIPSFTRAGLRRPAGFSTGLRRSPGQSPYTASAAAIWSSARLSRMPKAGATSWRACLGTEQASRTGSCIWDTGAR